MAQAPAETSPFLTYKGRPLVRAGNDLYYGSMAEDFVVMMKILSTKDANDMKMAEKIQVQLVNTDPTVPPQEMIVKTSTQTGLYNALNTASIWLDRAFTE